VKNYLKHSFVELPHVSGFSDHHLLYFLLFTLTMGPVIQVTGIFAVQLND